MRDYWDDKQKARSQKRLEYFRRYQEQHHLRVSMAYKGEALGLKVLIGSKRIYRPCDLSWEGKLVDVKTAKPTINNQSQNRWKFLLKKQKSVADLYLLICKDTEDKVVNIYLVPNLGKDNLSFNEKSSIKYKKYLLSL